MTYAQEINKEVINNYFSAGGGGLLAKNYLGLRIELYELNDKDIIFSNDNKVFKDENICFEVTPNRDGYLYILNEGTSGKLRLLYPHILSISPNNYLSQGMLYKVPEQSSWTFKDESGKDILYIIFTKTRDTDLEKKIETGMLKSDMADYLLPKIENTKYSSESKDFGNVKRKVSYTVVYENETLIFPLFLSHTDEGVKNSTKESVKSIIDLLKKNK